MATSGYSKRMVSSHTSFFRIANEVLFPIAPIAFRFTLKFNDWRSSVNYFRGKCFAV